MAPIDPSFLTTSPEWRIDGVGRIGLGAEASVAPAPAPAGGFGDLLAQQITSLQNLQQDAAVQGQALADGTATDATSVVMAVEKARLSMQLATQLRERGVTALQEILRTQV